MKAQILTIGDEILIGQIVDSNAASIAESLHTIGIDIVRMETVPDDRHAIASSLQAACASADLVITTGGLGPTHDDVTREAVAQVFRSELQVRDDVYRRIARRYAALGRETPPSATVQAIVPVGFDVIPNAVGTAPGLWKAWDDGDTKNTKKMIAVLPGVPDEMTVMMRDEVLPRVGEHQDLNLVRSRVLLTTGIGESNLQEVIRDIVPGEDAPTRLAYLPYAGGVRLRITSSGEDPEQVEADLDRLEMQLRERIDEYIFGIGDDTLEAAVGRLLRESRLTLAVAESCSGGLVVHRISNISGSSAYLVGGVMAYCNSVKMHTLGVDLEVLEDDGAVSEVVALQMAHGIRTRFGADIGISTTGIAGPTGGTPKKPVGTVWIAYAGPDGEQAVLLRLVKQRALNKELTATALLDLVRRRVLAYNDAKTRESRGG